MPILLRCTAKLLKRLRQPAKPPEPPPSANPLGEWYADIDFIDREPFARLREDHGPKPARHPSLPMHPRIRSKTHEPLDLVRACLLPAAEIVDLSARRVSR